MHVFRGRSGLEVATRMILGFNDVKLDLFLQLLVLIVELI